MYLILNSLFYAYCFELCYKTLMLSSVYTVGTIYMSSTKVIYLYSTSVPCIAPELYN